MFTLSEQDHHQAAESSSSSCDILRSMSFKPLDMSCSHDSFDDEEDEHCLSSPTSTIIFRDVSVDALLSSSSTSSPHYHHDIHSSSSSSPPSILQRANPVHDDKVVHMDAESESETDYHCRVISPFASLENVGLLDNNIEKDHPALALPLPQAEGNYHEPVVPVARLDYSRFFETDLSSSSSLLMMMHPSSNNSTMSNHHNRQYQHYHHHQHHDQLHLLEPILMGCDDFSLSSEEEHSMQDHDDEPDDDGIHDPAAFWEQGIHNIDHDDDEDGDDDHKDDYWSRRDHNNNNNNDDHVRCNSPAQVSLQSYHDEN